MSSSPGYDASASALGYIYQCLLGLLLALRKADDADLTICIEKVDDIAFEEKGTAVERLQAKHQLVPGDLKDNAQGLWKTIRIWSDDTHSGKLDPTKTLLYLVTTGSAPTGSGLAYLRGDTERNSETARKMLEAVALASGDAIIKKAWATYRKLSRQQKQALFEAINILDKSPTASDLRPHFLHELRLSAEARHRNALADRLQGWWLEQVISHLTLQTNVPIAVSRILAQAVEIAQQFHRDSLPDDFLSAQVPEQHCPTQDIRCFIRQLNLIRISQKRLRTAQEDYYRASAQRSRWIKDNLIDVAELAAFESRLLKAWDGMFQVMMEAIEHIAEDEPLRQHGLSLYNWSQNNAPTNSGLWVRLQFQAAYMTTGSFHILADKEPPSLGWHPHYERLLSNPGG